MIDFDDRPEVIRFRAAIDRLCTRLQRLIDAGKIDEARALRARIGNAMDGIE